MPPTGKTLPALPPVWPTEAETCACIPWNPRKTAIGTGLAELPGACASGSLSRIRTAAARGPLVRLWI